MKAQLLIIPAAIFITTASFNSSFPAKTKREMVKPKTENTGFAFLRTHRQEKGVTATWGLSSNAGVVGFAVQRTYEDPTDPYAFWEDICYMDCGSSRSFKHTDQSVFPGYISYRVIAILEDGSSITSEVSSVRIVSRK